METERLVHEVFVTLAPHLNERQKRLTAAAEAKALGRGGITMVARLTGLSRPTILKGLKELGGVRESMRGERVRRVGGGRKKARDRDSGLMEALERLVDPGTRGDPMSPLRWTCKSTRQLAQALAERGHRVSHRVVADLLKEQRYSLQAHRKTLEGSSHPARDAQFQYINDQACDCLSKGLPVISVDTKKKELIGQYKNGGQEWHPASHPEKVNVYDFVNPEVGKAIPYGVYDMAHNVGWVNVGCDHDTSAFALESIRRWWSAMGSEQYPRADKLLICADGGGSNGSRARLWKVELQAFSDETGLKVTVCHFPPGTSKWNKIEHRLFSHISMNLRGRPWVSHEVVVELISATTTRTGLTVRAELDRGAYPTKIRVSDEQMARVRLQRHEFHGEWNYTICPATPVSDQ